MSRQNLSPSFFFAMDLLSLAHPTLLFSIFCLWPVVPDPQQNADMAFSFQDTCSGDVLSSLPRDSPFRSSEGALSCPELLKSTDSLTLSVKPYSKENCWLFFSKRSPRHM
jgi:hypothetical protein